MGCNCTSKLFLTLLSVFFWIVSLGLIFIGGYIFYGYHHVEKVADSVKILIPAAIIIAGGIFLFLLGIIGCIGAWKEQKCLLGLYFTILLIVLVTMLAGGILAWIRKDDVKKWVDDGLTEGLNKYGQDNATEWTDEVDFVQEKLKCCGVHNYTDWNDTVWFEKEKRYPDSCCENKNCSMTHPHPTNSTVLYQQGCLTKLEDELKSHLGIIIGVAAAFVVIQLLGMICSCVLICRRKSEVPYIGLSDPDGMRV